VVIVAAGTLVGLGRLGFVESLLSATAGSTLGFLIMYKVGDWFGDHILEQGKIKFISVESVHKVERWFARYGYAIIVVNRFLTGTRAVVSFFAGMSELRLLPTTILCFLSALTWNAILVSLGMTLGKNWPALESYLQTYSTAATIVIAAVAGVVILYVAFRRRFRTEQK
jgi:membrane protein DedA with SNARE-associated domain